MGKPSLRPEDIVDPSAPWIKTDPTSNGWYEVWARYGWGGDHPREQVTTMLWRDGAWDRSDHYSKTAEVVAHLEPMRIPDTAHTPLDETGAVRLAEWAVRKTMHEYRDALRAELRHPADARKVETRRQLERCIMGRRFDILSMGVVDEGELIRREREKAILDVYHTPAPWFDWDRPAAVRALAEDDRTHAGRGSVQKVKEALRQNGAMKTAEVEKAVCLSNSCVSSALHMLENEGKVRKSRVPNTGRVTYIWELT